MRKKAIYHYYVEGEDERSLLNTLKRDMGCIESGTKTNYKSDIISCSNLGARLCKCQFDISKFWSQIPANNFRKFGNDAERIKIDKK